MTTDWSDTGSGGGYQQPTAAEHFAWARARAMEYVNANEAGNAMASFVQDLGTHEGTREILHADLLGLFAGEVMMHGARGARSFIEGLAGPPADVPWHDMRTPSEVAEER